MDMNEFIKTTYINPDVVRNAKEKKLVIIDEGKSVIKEWKGKEYQKAEFLVEIDKTPMTWMPNSETIRNLNDVFGTDSKKWLGKVVMLSTAEKDGKKYVVGFPLF